MKVLGVSVIAGVIVIIIIFLVLPIKPGGIPPPIEDSIGVDDISSIGIGVDEENTDIKDVSSIEIRADEDVAEVTDAVVVENKTDSDVIEETLPKRYVINVTDIPGLG